MPPLLLFNMCAALLGCYERSTTWFATLYAFVAVWRCGGGTYYYYSRCTPHGVLLGVGAQSLLHVLGRCGRNDVAGIGGPPPRWLPAAAAALALAGALCHQYPTYSDGISGVLIFLQMTRMLTFGAYPPCPAC